MGALGITFDETMAGPFALGEREPSAGARKGETEGTRLEMHARVTIADLDAFVADPDHSGQLAGVIDFNPLGQNLRADTGVFNLFSPAETPDARRMVYELAFHHHGRPFYLAGHKIVFHDRPFDLWTDVTTLFTTLHAGCNASGAIIGSGVLTLAMVELVKLMSTMRVVGADDTTGKAQALVRFGRFFMGELWDRYGPGSKPD
ncbi:MAG: hypothetical protein OXU75_16975 [Deltaproteobacteria bacterium]|nr:hypothetical protein [Deltaproteobacteria bacterium]